MLLAAGVLAAGTAGAAAAADQVWLALSIAASDRSQAGEAAALRDGRRLGPVVSAGRDRAYPLPGFVPADADDLARGLRIAPGRAHPPRLVLRRSPTGEFLLLDPDGAVLAVPAVREEPPVVAIELPLHLLRPLLPKAEGMDAEAVAAARGMGLVAPLRIASVDGGAGRMVRSHREGVRRRQTAALGAPVLRYTPAGGLAPDEPARAATNALPVGLGADLQARWLFSSVPPGAVVAFAGIADPVPTEVGIRNLPAAAVRSLVMRKDGYRDCRHADAYLDVVVRGGLEWNSVRCPMKPAPQ